MHVDDEENKEQHDQFAVQTKEATSQKELIQRTMQDSYLESFVPLSSDQRLRERYLTFGGNVRLGRIMEDLDFFSILVAQKHLLGDLYDARQSPSMVMTVSMDNIFFTDYLAKVF